MNHVFSDSSMCCGCTACETICPVSAISMEEDKEGFKVPIVRENCISCGKCIDICPIIKMKNIQVDKNKELQLQAYAFQNLDNDVRKKSASGAFFPAIARYIIEEKKGYVVGCILDDKLVPRHIVSNSLGDIEKMQDSKYVQSNLDDCFRKILQLIKQDSWILFTGTSCQVAGLKELIRSNGLSSAKVVTVDFFCHGTPSPKIWKEFLTFYQEEKKRDIVDVKFRCKKYLWGRASRGTHCKMTLFSSKNNKIKKDFASLISTTWYNFFWSNLILRKVCFECPYASVDKPADITMGDFWGIEDIRPEFNDEKGCSVLILRTQQAKDILTDLNNVEFLEVEVEEATRRQGNAKAPSKRPKDRERFWNDYRRNGFEYVLKKYAQYSEYNKIKYFIKMMLFRLHLRNIR